MALPAPTSYAEFSERVRCLAALFNCSATSGLRTPQRNVRVGGAATSKHLITFGGMAADLVPDEDTQEVRREVVSAAQLLGLWAVDEGDHVHTQGTPPTRRTTRTILRPRGLIT